MGTRKAVRAVAVLLMAVAALIGMAESAEAAPTGLLTHGLVALRLVLQTPGAQNPLGTPGADACWSLGGHVTAPFTPDPAGVPSCTVTAGTRILVVGASNECSTFEVAAGTDLVACARSGTSTVTSVTVDGRAVPLTYVETPVLPVRLTADNLFGRPAGSHGRFAAAGWVALLGPPPVGTHTIVGPTFTTTIVVR